MINPKLFYYHPERYFRSRPFASALLGKYREDGDIQVPTLELTESLSQDFTSIWNNEVVKLPFDERPMPLDIIQREMDMFMHYAAYYMLGRNIFQMLPNLLTHLRETDVDDVLLSDIALPFEVFYLSFGPQEKLNLWGEGALVDGAYINRIGGKGQGALQILLTTVRKDYDPKRPFHFITDADPHYYFALPYTHPGITVGEAVQTELNNSPTLNYEKVKDITGGYNILGNNSVIIDERNVNSPKRARRAREGFPVFQEALRLIINGLCYLSAYPDDAEKKYPEHAPENLVHKLERSTKANEIRRNESKLAALGYTRIVYFGVSLENGSGGAEGEGRGGEMPTHWRRGHWRSQAHGPRHSLRRLVWIKPVMVRKDKGSPEKGHIYRLEGKEGE